MSAGAIPGWHVVLEDFVLGSEDRPLIAVDVRALPRLMNHGQTHACSRSSAAARRQRAIGWRRGKVTAKPEGLPALGELKG